MGLAGWLARARRVGKGTGPEGAGARVLGATARKDPAESGFRGRIREAVRWLGVLQGGPVPAPILPPVRSCVVCGEVSDRVKCAHQVAVCGVAGTPRRLRLVLVVSWQDNDEPVHTCPTCMDGVLTQYGRRAPEGIPTRPGGGGFAAKRGR